jgi:hypothetical protein
MSDTGLTVPGMTELPRRYDVTITVDRDGGDPADPADFAVAAGQAASARAASIVSAHTASQIISIVTVLAADQPAAVAVALAVVSDALKRPVVISLGELAGEAAFAADLGTIVGRVSKLACRPGLMRGWFRPAQFTWHGGVF